MIDRAMKKKGHVHRHVHAPNITYFHVYEKEMFYEIYHEKRVL